MQVTRSSALIYPFFDYLIIVLSALASLIIGICFAIGVCWFNIMLLVAIIILLYSMHKDKRLILGALLLCAVGNMRMHYVSYVYKQTVEQIGEPKSIRGYVQAIEQANHSSYSYTLLIAVDAYMKDDVYQRYNNSWYLHCYLKHKPQVMIGDYVCVDMHAITTKQKGSFAEFLLKEGIHATAFISVRNIHTLIHAPYSFIRTCHAIKYRILKNILDRCSTTTGALIASIFLGNKIYVKKDYAHIKEIFAQWGIVHFLARSGIHLVIFILFLELLMQWIPLLYVYKHLISIGLCFLYTLLTWQSISFARALGTFLWYKLACLCCMQTQVIHIVSVLSIIFLIINPTLIFFLDFQLSFGITLVLAITTYFYSE